MSIGTWRLADVGASPKSSGVPAAPEYVTMDGPSLDGSPPEVCMCEVSSPDPTVGLVSVSVALPCSAFSKLPEGGSWAAESNYS